MAEATTRPDKVVGFHFFYPASMMRLIEVIEGEETSEETIAGGGQLRPGDPQERDPLRRGARLRRQPDPELLGLRDLAGADEEDLDPQEVDKVVKESGAVPMGPFFLADLLGPRHRAARRRAPARVLRRPLLRVARMKELVEAGNLGQKTGKGFYEHG